MSEPIAAPAEPAAPIEPAAPVATIEPAAPEGGDAFSATMEQMIGLADEGTRASSMFDKFKEGDIPTFLKSMVEQQKFLGNRGDIPGDDATPEQVSEFWGKLGVPADSKDYEFAIPEGFEPSDALVNTMREAAKEGNLTKDQLSKYGAKMMEHEASQFKQWSEQQETQKQEGLDMLENEWGEGGNEMFAAVRSLETHFKMSEDERAAIESNPHSLILLGRIAKDLDEKGQVGTVFNSTRQGLSDELTDVEGQIKNLLANNGANIKDPALDGLISQRERIQGKLN